MLTAIDYLLPSKIIKNIEESKQEADFQEIMKTGKRIMFVCSNVPLAAIASTEVVIVLLFLTAE
jgi:hypothetical protein